DAPDGGHLAPGEGRRAACRGVGRQPGATGRTGRTHRPGTASGSGVDLPMTTMLPMGASVALGALRLGRLAPGETVLVTAAAGGIGHRRRGGRLTGDADVAREHDAGVDYRRPARGGRARRRRRRRLGRRRRLRPRTCPGGGTPPGSRCSAAAPRDPSRPEPTSTRSPGYAANGRLRTSAHATVPLAEAARTTGSWRTASSSAGCRSCPDPTGRRTVVGPCAWASGDGMITHGAATGKDALDVSVTPLQ